MADLPAAPPAAEPLVYRPISGLALGGFLLSVLFAVIVLLSTLVALIQGAPVFFSEWVLVLPVAAAVVCFVAQRRIRNAEGTLAGLALARWGLRLSVLLGASHFVYSWVNGLAVATQADDFLMTKSDADTGFFPRLKNAAQNRTDFYQAFLLSLPTTSRGGAKAGDEKYMRTHFDQSGKDGEGGNITKFSKHPLVMALLKNADIEPLGVVSWNYDGNSYHVLRNYRFTTPELVIETAVPVQSTEGVSAGEQRKWFINVMKIPKLNSIKPTPYGKTLLDLRANSKYFLDRWRGEFIEQWRKEPAKRTPVAEYKDTDTDWAKIIPDKEQRAQVQQALAEAFGCQSKAPPQLQLHTDDLFADWKAEPDGRIKIYHAMRLLLPAANRAAHFNLELEIVVASKNPIDLSVPFTPPGNWEIQSIRVLRAAPTTKMMPGM
jgi:hypothetical protein